MVRRITELLMLAALLAMLITGLAVGSLSADNSVGVLFTNGNDQEENSMMSLGELSAEQTPAPQATPEEIAQLREICVKARKAIGSDLEGEPDYPGKLVFAVYQKDLDEGPVFSYVYKNLFWEVPDERLAMNLDEADTVVVTWPVYERAGTYSSGAPAFRCTTRVGVYDLKADRLMFTYTYSVNEPPKKVADSQPHNGRYDAYEACKEIGERLAAGENM